MKCSIWDRAREDGEFPLLIKDQWDYHSRFKVYFRMSVAKWMNLTITILDFGVRFYGGSVLSKHLSKCLPRMLKRQKIEPDPNFIMTDENFTEAVCKRD